MELFSHKCGSNTRSRANTSFSLEQNAPTYGGRTCPTGTETHKPAGDFGSLVGQQAGGKWKLEMNDTGAYDVGTHAPGACG